MAAIFIIIVNILHLNTRFCGHFVAVTQVIESSDQSEKLIFNIGQ